MMKVMPMQMDRNDLQDYSLIGSSRKNSQNISHLSLKSKKRYSITSSLNFQINQIHPQIPQILLVVVLTKLIHNQFEFNKKD